MSFSVRLSAQAEKSLGRLDRTLTGRILDKLEELSVDPVDPRLSKPLVRAAGTRSARVGDYRILFRLNRAEESIDVLDVRPRGRAYRDL